MTNSFIVRLFLLGLIFVAMVGCAPRNRRSTSGAGQLEPPATGMSVSDLAGRLGYNLTQTKADSATLVSGGNTLVILAEPRSEVYFNGYRVVKTQGIVNRDGQLMVPAELEGQIRQVLPAGALAGTAVKPPRKTKGPVTGRVVLDPGHGGKDPGAQAGGVIEKKINLEIASIAADELRRRGVTVMMTRRGDTYLELEDRAKATNAFRADLFVAVHADFNPSPEKVGHTILLPQSGNPEARSAGQWVDRAMTANGSPSHMVRGDTRGLYVLKYTNCPSILVEVGFLSNPSEAALLRNPAYRRQLAMGIANGIADYLAAKR